MPPNHKDSRNAEKVSRAVAYLKAVVPDDDPVPLIELPPADSPVLREFNQELLIAYLVDVGDHFEYVQYRDLEQSRLSIEELRANKWPLAKNSSA